MNIVVISDKNNEVRRQNIIKEFSNNDLDFKFFDAIMANKMSKEELATKSIKDTFLSPSEIGCALSHCGVYDEFLKSDEKSIMICEDDIYFTEYFNYDSLLKIKEFLDETDEPRLVVLQKSIYHHKRIKSVGDNVNLYSTRNAFCTHGYMINRAAARNIKMFQTPIRFEIDAFKFYYWLNACKLYCLDKDFIVQLAEDIIPSTVEKNWKDNRKAKKDAAYKELYNQLSLKGKFISQFRRLNKAINKPFESLDY
jgi:hypothetical protein